MSTESEKNIAANAEKSTEAEVSPPSLDSLLEGMDPKKLELAEAAGLPLKGIIDYLRLQEAKTNAIIQNLPDPEAIKRIDDFVGKVAAAQSQAQNQPVAAGNPGGGGIMGLLPALLQAFSGGGGQSDAMQKLQEEMFKVNIESMRTDISVGKALKNALVSRLGTKLVSEVLP